MLSAISDYLHDSVTAYVAAHLDISVNFPVAAGPRVKCWFIQPFGLVVRSETRLWYASRERFVSCAIEGRYIHFWFRA